MGVSPSVAVGHTGDRSHHQSNRDTSPYLPRLPGELLPSYVACIVVHNVIKLTYLYILFEYNLKKKMFANLLH